MDIKFYEMFFNGGSNGEVLIKATRKPTLTEAKVFWLNAFDDADTEDEITKIEEISKVDAENKYDISNIDEWEVFGA